MNRPAVLCCCLCALATGGCKEQRYSQTIVSTDFLLQLELVDSVIVDGQVVSGSAVRGADGTWCIISLPKAEYPRCLQHELRHCIEGNFHAGYASYEDCSE